MTKNWKFFEPEGQIESTEPEGHAEYVFVAIDKATFDDTQHKTKRKPKHGKTKKEILKKRKGMSRSPMEIPNKLSNNPKKTN